jgi:hypothetical protein
MAFVQAEELVTRDLSSGKVHKRYRIPGLPGLLTAEGDNLDQAGAYEMVLDPSELDRDTDYCRRCYPPGRRDEPMTDEQAIFTEGVAASPPGEADTYEVPAEAAPPPADEEAPDDDESDEDDEDESDPAAG